MALIIKQENPNEDQAKIEFSALSSPLEISLSIGYHDEFRPEGDDNLRIIYLSAKQALQLGKELIDFASKRFCEGDDS